MFTYTDRKGLGFVTMKDCLINQAREKLLIEKLDNKNLTKPEIEFEGILKMKLETNSR